MMAADGAVAFLLQKLDEIITREWSRISGIKDNIDDLKEQMKDIEAILRYASAREVNEPVQVWLNKVRDLAYDIEDVLDKFDLDVLLEKRSTAKFIENIQIKIDKVKNSKEAYYHNGLSSSQCHDHDTFSAKPGTAALPETDAVGMKKPLRDLMAWTKKKEPSLQVMFIVGVGGSGKTLLAKQVYEMMKKKFNIRDWLSVSSPLNAQQLLQSMARDLCKSKVPEQSSSNNADQLTENLRTFLNGKRYLVILDDLGSKEIWETLKCALPRQSRGRVIVTTRRGDIADLFCDNRTVGVYNHQLLPPAKAEKLFFKKAFPPNDERSESLLKLSKQFLLQCEGSPLAITSIGTLLSNTPQMEDAWKQLHDSLGSELQNNGLLSGIGHMFSTSWNELPHHLKCCLLYFAMFPEDYPLPRRKLIRLWISEGLFREVDGKTPEQAGEDCLKQLIRRGLVLLNESDFDGRAKFCHVHRLFHKIILSKAQEENFCQVVTDSNVVLREKARRLSVLKSCPSMLRTKFPVARTLFTFEIQENLSRSIAEKVFAQFSMLKVLDLQDAPLTKFPETILKLVLLRYLSLRNTKINQIPETISKLQILETLDLKHTLVTDLPSKVFKLKKLRHLLAYNVSIDGVQGFKTSWKIGRLEALQKVSMIKANNDHKMIQELQKLTNLRKLGIVDLTENDGVYLSDALQKMTNLQSLDLSASREAEYLDIPAMNNPPEHLQRLNLKGRLQKLPDFVSTLHDLLRIRLKWSKLSSSPIYALQDLPNLMELQLLDAYTGPELIFHENKFQKLKILELESLGDLETVIIEKGTLVSLQTLILRQCGALETAPFGIKRLGVLENLHLYGMSEKFLLNISIKFVPNIRTYDLDGEGKWIPRDFSPKKREIAKYVYSILSGESRLF